jgi:hypothetical protein
MEVNAEYPHDEVINPGINHFPEGVFKNCRTIIQRERDIYRERLRKSKRMKENNLMHNQGSPSRVHPQDSYITFPDSELGTDQFDLQWGQTLMPQTSPMYPWSIIGGDEDIDAAGSDEYA